MQETPCSESISTRLERIAMLARQNPQAALTTLAHHIDMEWLREAYRRTRKDGAKGIDGQSAEQYAADLEKNLQSLLDRTKSGRYRAPAVRRVYIPKANGDKRPLGIPTFEDKVLQRAVGMLLEAVYEQEFLDCSYGFRPRRSTQQAIDALDKAATRIAGGWIVELDIRKFFDSVDHERFRQVLHRRVRDGVVVRLIGKWLNAGVMEDGIMHRVEMGTPQGGVISPILANIFLHDVLDLWFKRDAQPRLGGKTWLIRYADDAVILCEREEDARRLMDVLPKRFGRYGLQLHPEKTRLVPFKRPDMVDEKRRAGKEMPTPGTFDFLGFTIHWGKSLAGKWVVRERTSNSRFRRALNSISEWCKQHRHNSIRDQQETLNAKLKGHYGYYGRVGNRGRIWNFLHCVERIWHHWLSSRSQRTLTWEEMKGILLRNPLARPRLIASRAW